MTKESVVDYFNRNYADFRSAGVVKSSDSDKQSEKHAISYNSADKLKGDLNGELYTTFEDSGFIKPAQKEDDVYNLSFPVLCIREGKGFREDVVIYQADQTKQLKRDYGL